MNKNKRLPSIYDLHNNKLKYFASMQKTLPIKQKELKNLKVNQNESNEIQDLEQNIKDIVNKTEEMTYWLDVYPILNKYEICENSDNKQIVSNGIITETINTEKNNIFRDYLIAINRQDLVELSYLTNVVKCDCNIPSIREEKSFIYCYNCGLELGQELQTGNISYKESQEYDYISYYYYKRINHFQECLNQFQAKENTTIPDEIIQCILTELAKERKSINCLNSTNTKLYLKKHNFSKYYEHITHIIFKINKKPIPQLSPEIEDKLKKMFQDIQKPFEKHKPSTRKNFLSYNYCFYKFFELLEMDEFLIYFPLLKDRQKLYQQDIIWEKICQDMKWEYYPSI